MKISRIKNPPVTVARSDSLLDRLQKASGPEDPPYLDQLMIFLETPPPGIRDRWKEGAKLCTAWDIPCTGASIWRLYRSYVLEWRLRLIHEAESVAKEPAVALSAKIAQLIDLRVYEVLSNPDAPIECLVNLARIEHHKRVFELARQKDRQSELRQAQKVRNGQAAADRFLSILRPTPFEMSPPPQPA